MEFTVRKTTELTNIEQRDILALFNNIFGRNRTLEQFRNQFLNNPWGYSYHSMMIDNEQIVGCISYIPACYLLKGKRHNFALVVDAMVGELYRGFINFYRMIIVINNYLRKENFDACLCFPNDSAYPIYIKSKLMKDVGDLDTYCLPYRIGGIKQKLKIFNWFSIAFVRCYVSFTALFASKSTHHFSIEKEAGTYNVTRYKRLDGNYTIAEYQGSRFAYKLMKYEGVRSAFLIDVFKKSSANFNKAIRYIIKHHHKEFDILLYVGHLPFRGHGLIQVPRKFAPKEFHFTGEILRKDEIDKDLFFNLDNWDVNLSNYDLL
ncbi:MAG: GNAT family N-acetyltransferase [Prevotella sp.]|jgi:hypothetical protein|nr:GNAT family N-acetyltransferase [Prevotella sp.]